MEPYCAFDPPNAWEEFTRRRGIPCYNYPILVAGVSKYWCTLLLILPAMFPVTLRAMFLVTTACDIPVTDYTRQNNAGR